MASRRVFIATVLVAVAVAGCTKARGEVDGALLTFPNGEAHPTAGTVVVSSHDREVKRMRTDRDGSFTIHLEAGTYTLDATTAAGVKCSSHTVKIRNSGADTLSLICI